MKRLLASFSLAAVCFACTPEQTETIKTITNPTTTASRQEIDNLIWGEIKQNKPFTWDKVSDEIIWSALQQSDNVLSVGFKPAGVNADLRTNIHTIDINQGEWKAAKETVLALILEEERKSNPDLKLEQLEVFAENTLPVVNVRVTSLSTIKRLRSSNLTRYAEPMGYEPTPGKVVVSGADNGKPNVSSQLSDSGCGQTTEDFSLTAGTYFTTVLPNAKSSWNHNYHKVANAWTKAPGAGIRVMIIDSGIVPTQDNFGSQFNQGLSTGRSIEKLVTLPRNSIFGIPYGDYETPDDKCGHGSAMAGALAAPRGTDGNAAGIAYNANVTTVRATSDVFLDESREVKGVSDAYIIAGNRSDIKITSMSLGRMTSSSQLADAIRYATNRGKLVFCAGGTSFSWAAGWYGVIFPASMPEVVAVTGLKENLTRCDVCHEGSEIDFTIVMERNADKKHALTTAATGNQPGTVGGSSVATAQTAGMAAVIWSRFPTWTKDQVLNRMIQSASNYPNRNSKFGWGLINLDKATNTAL